jgi:hypothetical protein
MSDQDYEVPRLNVVLGHVEWERRRQDRKWGEQNWPDVCPVLMNRRGGCSTQRMAQEYEIPTAQRARFRCETEFSRGDGTWADILIEEVAEAIEAGAQADTAALRKELVQIAAVAVAWVEAIDRRGGEA